MLFTEEFYDAMDQFERCAKDIIQVGSMGFQREDSIWFDKRRYYSDGNVNEAFIFFLHGYALAKNIYQNEQH